jgi:hypothetical protein
MRKILNQAQEIVDYLVNKVDDIDLIYLFGGLAQGRAHPRSDIEMVTVSDKKIFRWEYVLDDRPIFIWPKSWEQLENIATAKNGHWSVAGASIVHAKVLWQKSVEMKRKFVEIQKKAKSGANDTLRRSINTFDGLYGKLWRIQKAIETERIKDINFLIWDILKEIINSLAALNNQFLLNNWGKQIQELETFKIIPENFIERYLTLLQSPPEKTLQIASDLVDDVNKLLKNWILENQVSFVKDLEEIVTDWPTVLEFQNKAISAAEEEDFSVGLYAASDNAWFDLWAFTALRNIKWNMSCFFSATDELRKLPTDITNNLTILLESKNLFKIQKATCLLADQLRIELKNAGWTLPECSSLEEAFRYVKFY